MQREHETASVELDIIDAQRELATLEETEPHRRAEIRRVEARLAELTTKLKRLRRGVR